MIRRDFLARVLMLLGFDPGAWAQSAAEPRYRALTHAVRIPLDAVTTPWQPVPFTAEGAEGPGGTKPGRVVLFNGVLFRRGGSGGSGPESSPPTAGAAATELSALCVTCPHEQCQVELITSPVRLKKMSGIDNPHPLFECGCHFSVFDALQDGARISGLTPRGLYRFRITAVSEAGVEIGEVEEAALSAL
jgi:Rieske Fe-S protein